MEKRFGMSRGLLAAVVLAVIAAVCTVSTAHAASSASAGRMSTKAPRGPAASSTQCNFVESLQTCKSTDPTVAYYDSPTGNILNCTFAFDVTWGDGSSTTKTLTDPPAGHNLVAKHAYVGPGVYTVTVTVTVTVGTCTGTNSVHTFTLTSPGTEPQPDWAGWSWYPRQGTVTVARAEWKVPKVNCSAPPRPKKAPDLSRVAVWVGLWGPDYAGNNRWLPQIGTASLCVAGIPRYFAIYQMYNGAGGGTSPATLSLKGLKPNDTVQAQVSYVRKYQGRLQFKISIKDITRNSTAGKYLVTPPNVPLVDAAYQGGALVEDNGDKGDLARFDTPITIRNIQVAGGSGGSTRWTMAVSGSQIAKTGNVSKGSFTVTWLNY